uniref:Uncharacterized protein n=1 Tax=Panagrolaimus sp. ES5 TaxID=591445 RepID=A0AC34F821_9BILA
MLLIKIILAGGSPGTTLPNDPTCQCGSIPSSGALIATPPIVIINPFTCLITVTLQCIDIAIPPAFPTQRLQFNGDNTFLVPTPPPFTVTCGGTGEYTFIRPPLTLTILSSVTCVV